MTRREGLAALLLMFLLFTSGLAWQFGSAGLIAAAVLGAAAVLFAFQRVERAEQRRAEHVPDTVQELLGYGGRLP